MDTNQNDLIFMIRIYERKERLEHMISNSHDVVAFEKIEKLLEIDVFCIISCCSVK